MNEREGEGMGPGLTAVLVVVLVMLVLGCFGTLTFMFFAPARIVPPAPVTTQGAPVEGEPESPPVSAPSEEDGRE